MFELSKPRIKKIIEIINDHILTSFCFSKGHNAINKKTTLKTIPKFLFVGNLIFFCIYNQSTIFSFKSKALINSFHSLFERPDSSEDTFLPAINFFIMSFPFAETSVPPTL